MDLVFIYDYDIEGVSFFLGRVFLNVVLNIKVYIVNFFILKKMFFVDLVWENFKEVYIVMWNVIEFFFFCILK